MTFHLKVGGSAASETDIIEGRVIDDNSTVRTDSSLQSANSIDTFGAVISPVTASVTDSADFTVVWAFESDVVDGRVVRRVAGWADSQLETLHVSAKRASLSILENAGAIN